MVEHQLCKLGVIGSIPLASTILSLIISKKILEERMVTLRLFEKNSLQKNLKKTFDERLRLLDIAASPFGR